MISQLRVKMRALSECLRFAKSGADWASWRMMLYVGIIAHIYPARRRWLLGHLESHIARRADGGLIQVSIRRSSWGRSTAREIVLRAGNRADYQTAWECLGNYVYPAPDGVDVRHLIDGGANIGLFSVWHSGLPNLQNAILVEPDPKNLELLRHNLRGETRFSIIPAALSDRAGESFFEEAEANTGHLAGMPGHSASQRGFPVSCKRLVDVMPPDWKMEHTWLKLDIEGAEYIVLDDLLSGKLRPAAISIEIHEYPTAGGKQLVAKLEAAGYSIDMLNPGEAKNTCRQVTAIRIDSMAGSRQGRAMTVGAKSFCTSLDVSP